MNDPADPSRPGRSRSGQPELARSALHDRHLARGAKMADFGGWLMPIEYPGGGVLQEHRAVRETVGVFDVSHLGKGAVRGAGAVDFVNACLANDLRKITTGRAQYTLCCDPVTGGVVDDLIAYLRAPDDVLLVPNAANNAEVLHRLAAAAPPSVTVTDQHRDLAVLAVQGPRSPELLSAVGLDADLSYMSFQLARWRGQPLLVCRSGYTGEHGYELLPGWQHAGALWDELLGAGADLGVRPCGLGARDTLRTEMGYPLHGHELSLDITPVQARAGWAVGWDKPAFWGRDVLVAERQAGPRRLLWGLRAHDRGIPRPQMTVTSLAGAALGEVTSGTFSPSLRSGIGLALLARGTQEGDEVHVDVRGRASAMTVVRPPLVSATPR